MQTDKSSSSLEPILLLQRVDELHVFLLRLGCRHAVIVDFRPCVVFGFSLAIPRKKSQHLRFPYMYSGYGLLVDMDGDVGGIEGGERGGGRYGQVEHAGFWSVGEGRVLGALFEEGVELWFRELSFIDVG